MRTIVSIIKSKGSMNGYEISDLCHNVLGYKKKSAGGIMARAFEYGLVSITGTIFINGEEYNIYS